MVRAALVHGNAAHFVSLDSGYSRHDSRVFHGFCLPWASSWQVARREVLKSNEIAT